MNIRNYTSGVSSETTIARIEARIAAAGAVGVMKRYDGKGRVVALEFKIDVEGQEYVMRVPANVDACYEAMWKEYQCTHSHPRDNAKGRIFEQALRTSWKLVQDWIDVQVSLIIMKQAEWREVFLPYIVWNGKDTCFQTMKDHGFKFKALIADKT